MAECAWLIFEALIFSQHSDTYPKEKDIWLILKTYHTLDQFLRGYFIWNIEISILAVIAH